MPDVRRIRLRGQESTSIRNREGNQKVHKQVAAAITNWLEKNGFHFASIECQLPQMRFSHLAERSPVFHGFFHRAFRDDKPKLAWSAQAPCGPCFWTILVTMEDPDRQSLLPKFLHPASP